VRAQTKSIQMIVPSDGTREGIRMERGVRGEKSINPCPLIPVHVMITSRRFKVTFQSYNIIKMPLKATHKFDLISL
jgi:hypothetical protein